jgi:hypothetical protein
MIRTPCLALMAAVALPAWAGFDGAYAPGNWNVQNIGTLTGGSPVPGSAVFSALQLVITDSNTVSPDPANYAPGCQGGAYGDDSSPCRTLVSIATPGTYTFSWSYLTTDFGGPGGDIFGVIVDGTRIALSDPGGPVSQAGVRTFTAGSSFGWYFNCTDCIEGAASATITNFAAVPEPSSTMLWGAGGLALAGCWRRSRPWAGAGPGRPRRGE